MPPRTIASSINASDPQAVSSALRRLGGYADDPIASVKVSLEPQPPSGGWSDSATFEAGAQTAVARWSAASTVWLTMQVVDRQGQAYPPESFASRGTDGRGRGRWVVGFRLSDAEFGGTGSSGLTPDLSVSGHKGRLIGSIGDLYVVETDASGTVRASMAKPTSDCWVQAGVVQLLQAAGFAGANGKTIVSPK